MQLAVSLALEKQRTARNHGSFLSAKACGPALKEQSLSKVKKRSSDI